MTTPRLNLPAPRGYKRKAILWMRPRLHKFDKPRLALFCRTVDINPDGLTKQQLIDKIIEGFLTGELVLNLRRQ